MACRGLSSPFHAYAYSNNKKHHRHSLPKQIQSPINRNLLSLQSSPGIPSAVVITRAAASTAMDSDERRAETISENPPMKLLFVEMGVGYDQHGCGDARVQGCYFFQFDSSFQKRGKIVSFEVVDGGLICSSGVYLEAMGDKNDDCYVVNAAVYVGY
ncbi:uncharacterized protein LOC131245357 isoform X3 [Magnolia sinica]|uniref:uncharacterized protein LOC131245357 isoform X3 n=1 Tax=Magnolia sinica TaxID=86752 RepID=UPI002658D9C7|nr:uncharacterized protein LOC131245357 isoform X3 [Magnolia sinica]